MTELNPDEFDENQGELSGVEEESADFEQIPRETNEILPKFTRKSPKAGEDPQEKGRKRRKKYVKGAAIEVSEELAELYNDAQNLLTEALNDSAAPYNQKAQVLNSVNSLLQQIAKTRTDLYNAEVIRKIEQTLIRTLKSAPLSVQKQFMADYERALAQSSDA